MKRKQQRQRRWQSNDLHALDLEDVKVKLVEATKYTEYADGKQAFMDNKNVDTIRRTA
jgi:hypothetical protein